MDTNQTPEPITAGVLVHRGICQLLDRGTMPTTVEIDRLVVELTPAPTSPNVNDRAFRQRIGAGIRHLVRLGEDVPSPSTWARATQRQLGKRVLASFREGARGIRESQVYLTAEDRPRNHTWQMDHAHLPLRVSLGDGSDPVDVWLTSVIDVGTRFLMGWTLTVHRADGASVREALLMGLYGCRAPDGERIGGVPELILWDRGLEFLADIVLATTDAFRTLGIALPPFSPHRKGKIERWFRSVKGECIDFLLGSTRGPTDLRGKHYNADEAVDFAVLQQAVAAYIDYYNFERVHSSLGCSPWQAWSTDTTAIRPAPPHAVFNAMARASRRHKVTNRGSRSEVGSTRPTSSPITTGSPSRCATSPTTSTASRCSATAGMCAPPSRRTR